MAQHGVKAVEKKDKILHSATVVLAKGIFEHLRGYTFNL
jgi:hypothetical protein